MLKTSLLFSATVWLYLITVSTYTHAQDAENFWILTNPEPPFVMVNDKRQMDGYLIDVIDGITHVAGINQHILAAPWERVELEARSKSNVLAFALARTPDREDKYHWITPLTANVYSVFSAIGEKDQFSDLSQLSDLPSIAVLENDARHNILIKAKYPAIHAFATWNQAIESVTSGKSAAIFFSDPGMNYFCTTLGKDCSFLKRVFMYRKIMSYLSMSKVDSNPVLVDTLTKAAEEFKQSSQFNDTVAKWLNNYQSQPIAMHMDNGVMNLWQQ